MAKATSEQVSHILDILERDGEVEVALLELRDGHFYFGEILEAALLMGETLIVDLNMARLRISILSRI